MRTREERLKGILKTIATELGQQAVDYVNGDNGMKRWSDAFKGHVLDSLHLGRVHDADTRALIRAVKMMSYITFHNDTFVSAEVDLIVASGSTKKAHVHDLRTRLGSLWMEARQQRTEAVDRAILTLRFKNELLRFTEQRAITCSSDSSVGYVAPQELGKPKIPAKPLYSLVSFRGNYRGVQPAGGNALQTTMFLDVGKTTYSGVALKTVQTGQFSQSRKEDEFGVYFLPWLSLKLAQLSLPQPPQGASQIFFTSSLSGCSVFIKGPPLTPTVYHLGVDSSQHGKVGDFVDDAKLPSDSPTALKTAYGAKDAKAFWWALLSWKLGLTGTPAANHFVEVSKDDYLNTPRLRTLTQHLGGGGGATISTFGTVFGVWKPGGWTFYLQENAVIFGGQVNGQIQFPLRLSQVFPVERQIMVNANPPKHKLGLM
jgi:hypothetical protein